jgi:hypothetical protein
MELCTSHAGGGCGALFGGGTINEIEAESGATLWRNSMSLIYRFSKLWLLTFATALLVLPTGLAQAVEIIFSASGSNAAAIQSTVDAFRSDFGNLNLNVILTG